jgi:hypothetical protein
LLIHLKINLSQDTGQGAASAEDPNNIGLKLQGEIAKLLGKWHICPGRSGTTMVRNTPDGVWEDGLFLVGALNGVNLVPTLSAKVGSPSSKSQVIIVLAIGRRLCAIGPY